MNPLPHPIGQKVVCVHGHFPSATYEAFDRVPEEGGVYTVNDLFWAQEHATGRMILSIRLTELPPVKEGWGGFSLWRFRLLEDEKIIRRRAREKAAQGQADAMNPDAGGSA